jgi:hypothetical protein
MRLNFNINDLTGFINIDTINTLFIKLDNCIYTSTIDKKRIEFCIDVLVKNMGDAYIKVVDTKMYLCVRLNSVYAKSEFINLDLNYFTNNLDFLYGSSEKKNIDTVEVENGVKILLDDREVFLDDLSIYNISKPYGLTRLGMIKCLQDNKSDIEIKGSVVVLPILYGEKREFITT